MCGIAGVIHRGQLQDNERLSRHFIQGLKHRGPDYQNATIGTDYLLAHTRLAIIDLKPEANQPFDSSIGNLSIVFNGEIYNYQELKRLLEKEGCAFRTSSDTEVLLQAFITWGEKMLQHIDGMFAFAIYNKAEKTLFAARDRAGKKPFFYCLTPDLFCFASEQDVIATSGVVKNQISASAVNSFLAIGYVLAPGSLYENIYQLEPGTGLWLNAHNFTVQKSRYWDILNSYQSKIKITRAEASKQLRTLLTDAVKKRLIADVEIGTFLSGGLDSSIISALAAKQQSKLKAFTAGFNKVLFDESAQAAIVANYLGLQHLVCQVPIQDEVQVRNTIALTDGVLADTSILAMNPLAKFTAGHVKAVLSGDGADELFGGYATYKAMALKNKLKFLPGPVWSILLNAGRFLPQKSNAKISFNYKWNKFFGSAGMDNIQAHYFFREHHTVEERIDIMGAGYGELIRETDPLIKFRQYYSHTEGLDSIEKLLYVDFKTWLPDDILVKTDRACMAWGLEVRSPFLDTAVMEFVASLPAAVKLDAGYTKALLKDTFKQLLPAEVLNRQKSGFNVPIHMAGQYGSNEYKFFNYAIYKQQLDGKYCNTGI